MKKTSLLRSAPYLLLVLLSFVAIGIGGWLSTRQISAMTTALLGGTATGVEVYAGQSWVVLGATVLGAGVIGLLLSLALAAAKALVPQPPVDAAEPVGATSLHVAPAADDADLADAADAAAIEQPVAEPVADDSAAEPAVATSAR